MILAAAYPSIPDVYAVHWGTDGRPDRYDEKSRLNVMTLPLMALVMVFLLSATGLVQRSGNRAYPTTDDPDEGVAMPWSDSLNARMHFIMGSMNRWLAWMILGLSLGMSILSVAITVPAFSGWLPVGLGVTLVSVGLGVVTALVTAVQNPARLRILAPDEAELERTRLLREDRNYEKVHRIGGLIYSNPADPMLLVPAQRQDGNVNVNAAHTPARRFRALLLGSLALLVLIPLVTSL